MNAHPALQIRELDVRPLLASGQGPLLAILEAVRQLPAGAGLRLIAPFEPAPLYAKLGDAGFEHETVRRDDGAFEITFTPRGPWKPDPVLLDLRGLEPPQPMQRVLEELATLAPGGVLLALTRFRPVHLLEILDQRGCSWETAEMPDGTWETVINHPSAGSGA